MATGISSEMRKILKDSHFTGKYTLSKGPAWIVAQSTLSGARIFQAYRCFSRGLG